MTPDYISVLLNSYTPACKPDIFWWVSLSNSQIKAENQRKTFAVRVLTLDCHLQFKSDNLGTIKTFPFEIWIKIESLQTKNEPRLPFSLFLCVFHFIFLGFLFSVFFLAWGTHWVVQQKLTGSITSNNNGLKIVSANWFYFFFKFANSSKLELQNSVKFVWLMQ